MEKRHSMIEKKPELTTFHWDLTVQFPEAIHPQVLSTVMSGMPNMRIDSPRTSLLLCGMPKSGSLYATALLAHALGFVIYPIGFDMRNGHLYYPRALGARLAGKDTISHCHAVPSHDTLRVAESLSLRPVVLTRDLLDALVSRRDMLVRDKRAGNLLSVRAVERFLAADEEEQLDTVIDLFAPAALNFIAGWENRSVIASLRPIHVTYAQLVSDPVSFVTTVAEAVGRTVEPQTILDMVEGIRSEGGVNYSRGEAGRGQRAFTEGQLKRLALLAERHGLDADRVLSVEHAVL